MRSTYRLSAAVLAICLCLIAVLVNSGPVHALNGLTVSPPLREITLGPGLLETTAGITVQNNTGQQVRAHIQLVDLRALGQYGGTSLDKAGLTDKYDLANWMSLPGGDTVVIAKGETVTLQVKITNRNDLTPGGHYGAAVITTSADNTVQSNVNINQQLVALMFIKKLGGEVYGLQAEPLKYQDSSIPEKITTQFKSTGNVHVTPRGYIEVTDPKGKLVAKGIINEDSSIILPGSTRQFVTLMQPVAGANMPGRYKITAYYRYDGQNNFMTESTYFTHGASHQVLLIAAAVLAVIAVIGTYLVLRSKRHKRPRN